MTDLVDCAECSLRYDSGTNAFCPRCGSTGGKVPATAAAPAALTRSRADPARKRVQRGGIILMVMGGFFLVNAAAGFLARDALVAQLAQSMADQPGGTFEVTALGAFGGQGWDGANVTLLDADGQAIASATLDAQGKATLASPGHAYVNVTVARAAAPNETWSRPALATQGATARVRIDTSEAAGHDPRVAIDGRVAAMTSAGFYVFLALALLVTAGGVAAFRLRRRGLALAGASAGALLGILATFQFLLVGLLVALPLGYAFAAVLRGRPAFA